MEEDIELLKKINITVFGTKEELDKLGRNLEDIDVNKIIENLINKNKELEKVVELMAKYIQALISKYEDDTYTYTSIIDYFKKKVRDEE